jgi:hypothetical protein
MACSYGFQTTLLEVFTMNSPRLMSRYELRETYGGIPQDRPAPKVKREDVPEVLHALIPLAEKWGVVADDWEPREILEEVPREEIEDLVECVSPHVDSTFNEWLAGPEAEGPEFTVAYLAFTDLRMCFWRAQWVLKHWNTVHLTPEV